MSNGFLPADFQGQGLTAQDLLRKMKEDKIKQEQPLVLQPQVRESQAANQIAQQLGAAPQQVQPPMAPSNITKQVQQSQPNLGGGTGGGGGQSKLGSALSAAGQIQGQSGAGGDVASGALSGATAGAAFGPVGAGVGAVVGGIAGGLSSRSKRKAAKAKAKQQAYQNIAGIEERRGQNVSSALKNIMSSLQSSFLR